VTAVDERREAMPCSSNAYRTCYCASPNPRKASLARRSGREMPLCHAFMVAAWPFGPCATRFYSVPAWLAMREAQWNGGKPPAAACFGENPVRPGNH
jgi:hypothetical protein